MKKHAIVSASLMALLLSAQAPFPGIAQSAPVETVKKTTLAELDQKALEAARQEMQKLAEGAPIELDQIIGENPECWVISAKNGRGEVLVQKQGGAVVSVHVKFGFKEVSTALQNAVNNTLKSLDAKLANPIDRVERIKSSKENVWHFRGERAEVVIEAASGQVDYASIRYRQEQIAPKIVTTAKQSLIQLSGSQTTALEPSATLLKHPQRNLDRVWSFQDKTGKFSVMIGANTGTLVGVSNYSAVENKNYVAQEDIPKVFAKPMYTKGKAIAVINPMMKKIFHLDLTGYAVASKYNTYTFTKKGKPTVIASVNKAGVFYSVSVVPENGMSK
ncbi:UNVERIFIED_CONTAM: hypothetical protein ABID98_005660 [Brevibacillus sp. OAP136]